MPFRSPLERRVGLIVLMVSLALAEPMLGFDARAVVDPPSAAAEAGEASSEADLTWGVGPNEVTGRAERVRAIVVVGRKAYLGGDFTAMVPPGSTWASPTTTSTSTSSTTTSSSAPTAAPMTPASASTSTSTTVPRPTPPALPKGSQERNYLAALDVDKHTLLPWNPDADGPVYAIVVSPDGTKLYVGGDFNRIGGTAAPKVARIDVATGKVDPTFTPGVTGRVKALALAGDRLYVGGSFDAVGGSAGLEPRPKLAALDAATGDLLPWMPPPLGPGAYTGHNGVPAPTEGSGDVLAVAVPGDGSRVFVAGSFLDFAGRSGLVVLDGTTGEAAPEQYTIKRPLFDLDVWPADNETVFAAAGGSGGHVYAFHADQPGKPLWSTWVDGDAPGVAASETDVYLMGHYDYAGPQKELRRHLAAFDADSGAVEGWNPVANTPQGAFSAAVGAGHVFVGGEFTRINGHPQPGFAQFDLAPAPPTTTTGTSPRPRPPHPKSRPRLRPSRATMSG
jgi:hypothetical protein